MLIKLGILLTVGFFLATTTSYLVSRQSIRQAILSEELPLTSDNIYSEIQRDLFQPILISSVMANDTFVHDWLENGELDPALIEAYLAAIKIQYQTVSSFLVSDATRNYYHPGGILKQVREDSPEDAWFFRVREMSPDYEINVDPDMANRDELTIFINYRVVDEDGNFLAATGIGLTVTAVRELMAEYERRFHRQVSFFDLEGNLVMHSYGSDAEAESGGYPETEMFRQLRAAIESGKSGESKSVIDDRGSLVNFRYIPELDWILVVEQSSDHTRTILMTTFGWNFVIGLVTAGIVLTMIHLAILRYQRGIERRNNQLETQNRQIEEQSAALQKANARLDALHKEKDDFVGITAHDLKTPLNSIVGFTQLLADEPELRPDARESVACIEVASRQMLTRVESLLHLSELENQRTPTFDALDALMPLRAAIRMHQSPALAKGIEFKIDLPETSVGVMGQAQWLTEIFSNLLSNAVKYSPSGGVVTIRAGVEGQHGVVTVADQGCGIDEENQKHLFKKFGRLSSRPIRGESSTGLGLYIVKQMVTRMQGTVGCESAPGKGSVFRVALPRA